MSKTTTPKYVVNMTCWNLRMTNAAWRGRATEKRLREYLLEYNRSLLPGGANYRIAEIFGYQNARATGGYIMRNNSSHEVVATAIIYANER